MPEKMGIQGKRAGRLGSQGNVGVGDKTENTDEEWMRRRKIRRQGNADNRV